MAQPSPSQKPDFLTSHSQAVTTSHPMSFSAAAETASRSWFRRSFGLQ
jgi:hypothetical protein